MTQKVTKIVFSGGPGIGKTTILNALKNLGYEVRSEVFTEIFSQANKENAFEILFQNKKKLISDLIKFQNKNEKIDFMPKENLLFLDRGMHDIFGFSQQLGYRLDAEELFQIQNQNYDLCIMPDPLEEKFYDQNLVRRQTYQESLVHHKTCMDFYISYFQARKMNTEKHLIFVPAGDVEFRVDFVLKISSFFVHNKKTSF